MSCWDLRWINLCVPKPMPRSEQTPLQVRSGLSCQGKSSSPAAWGQTGIKYTLLCQLLCLLFPSGHRGLCTSCCAQQGWPSRPFWSRAYLQNPPFSGQPPIRSSPGRRDLKPLTRCGGHRGVQPHAGQLFLVAVLRLRQREGLAWGQGVLFLCSKTMAATCL